MYKEGASVSIINKNLTFVNEYAKFGDFLFFLKSLLNTCSKGKKPSLNGSSVYSLDKKTHPYSFLTKRQV